MFANPARVQLTSSSKTIIRSFLSPAVAVNNGPDWCYLYKIEEMFHIIGESSGSLVSS